MKDLKTTIMGLFTIAGTAYKIYNQGSASAEDFALIMGAIGLILAKDSSKEPAQGSIYQKPIGDDKS